MATVQAELTRNKTQLNDPRAVKSAPKDALRSLPATIEWLRREGLLMETDVEVDGDLQLTGIQKHFDGSYPILFNNVKGYPHARAITNLFANMDIVDRMFGYENATDRTRKLSYSLTHPIANEVIAQDEATSIVYGMPREAVRAGVVSATLGLSEIAPYLIEAVA